MHCSTGSQWSSCSTGVTLSYFLFRVPSLEAASPSPSVYFSYIIQKLFFNVPYLHKFNLWNYKSYIWAQTHLSLTRDHLHISILHLIFTLFTNQHFKRHSVKKLKCSLFHCQTVTLLKWVLLSCNQIEAVICEVIVKLIVKVSNYTNIAKQLATCGCFMAMGS